MQPHGTVRRRSSNGWMPLLHRRRRQAGTLALAQFRARRRWSREAADPGRRGDVASASPRFCTPPSRPRFRRNRRVVDRSTGQRQEQPRRARPSASVPTSPTVQHVGQPRQATAVTGSSASEIGPTTPTRTIASTAATSPPAPLKRCARTEPLAIGERLVVAGLQLRFARRGHLTLIRGSVPRGSPARKSPRLRGGR